MSAIGIAPGMAARLALAEHGELSARVAAVLDGRMLVALIARAPAERSRLLGLAATVRVPTPRGIWRAEGIVTSAGEDGTVELRLQSAPEVAQRREHVRQPSRLPAVVRPRDGSLPPLHTYTLDVSGGGVHVAGAGPHEPGTPVAVTLKLTDDETLTLDGRIARRTDAGTVGIVFEDGAEAERERIVRWIFERQRLERAAARGRR